MVNYPPSVLILSHFYKRAPQGGGPPQDLRDFLLSKVDELVYIEHPFPYAEDRRSSVSFYRDGKLIYQRFTGQRHGPSLWFYLTDQLISWRFLWQTRTQFDLVVALDNLNCLTLVPLRWLGRVKKLVYYTIDYTPFRFDNRIINWLYKIADRLASYWADHIWALDKRMIDVRIKSGSNKKRIAPVVLLPMGAKLSRIKPLPLDKINRHQLIFVGHLLEKQGLQLVIESLPRLAQAVKDVRLVVIGQGEYEPALRAQAKALEIDDHISWQGFVADHREVEEQICQSAIGVAPYVPEKKNFTYYTDPGKPKLYLGCGLPVVMTDVPASARLISERQAGIIIAYDLEELTQALLTLLTDHKSYSQYRERALKLSQEFDTDHLIAKALSETYQPSQARVDK